MRNIYIIHSRHNEQIASYISTNLRSKEYNIIRNDFELGTDYETNINEYIKKADIHLAIISNESLNSKYFFNEIIQSRNYSTHSRNKLFIPIFLPNIDINALPDSIRNIQGIFLKDDTVEELDNLTNKLDEAINLFLGKRLAKEENTEKVKEKIETSAPTYIQETLSGLTKRESNLKGFANFWYFLGFITLLLGVIAAIWFANSGIKDFGDKENWSRTIFFAIKSVLIIVLLIAGSKYSFNLGKSYMNEALKVADRIHAISFGKFYLQVFEQQVEPSDIKEIFRDWNISGKSSFMELNSNDHDPMILDKIVELIEKIKGSDKK